jgi:hypothetical protein
MTTATAFQIDDFDGGAAETFASRIGEVLDAGAIAVMISIGHRTGLFDVLAALPPSTSTQIAEQAALAERYVHEWLASMVTGGIVAFDPSARTYRLPPEHAACLTRGAPLGNLAVYGQFVALMGAVQDRILSCFESGEGTGYGDYPCFHPMASLLYAISCTHCTPVSLGQGGPGLGTMWGWETAQQMLEEAGYASVKRHVLPHDPMNVWFLAAKQDGRE